MEELNIEGCVIEWLGHASFRIRSGDTIIYIDPFVLDRDPPPADIILATHDHFDHCAVENITALRGPGTVVVTTSAGAENLDGNARSIGPGEAMNLGDLRVRTIPAYNINKFKSPGQPFHPAGDGLGFIMEIGGKRIYHSGDTDAIGDMEALGDMDIDVALLPIGGTYTMDAAEAAEAVEMIKPKMVVPMHFGTLRETRGDIDLFQSMVGSISKIVVLDQKG